MEAFLAACVVAGIPIFLATLGELITEKSGCLNLGVEGMMLMGAVFGFLGGLYTENVYVALLCSMLAGAAGALIYAVIVVTLRANQVVTGLTLTIFGTGIAAFIGQPLLGKAVPEAITQAFSKVSVPLLGDIPLIGPVFFRQDPFVYLSYLLCVLAMIYLYKTRIGRNLRAVGENTAAADASGIHIMWYKYAHILAGGAFCGLGGAYLSLVRVPIWQQDLVNGRGWIAVALVIFASWNPVKAFLGALLFGGLSILGMRLQLMGVSVSQYIVDMVPYIATIVVVILSTHKNRKEDMGPADLSNNYFREER